MVSVVSHNVSRNNLSVGYISVYLILYLLFSTEMTAFMPETPISSKHSLNIIDSHCHLDFASFDNDRDKVLHQCADSSVSAIVIPGVLAHSWDALLRSCEPSVDRSLPSTSKPNPTTLYCALGLHPVFLDHHKESHLAKLDQMLSHKHVYAVGEIGLDFFIKTLDKEKQTYFFEQQLLLAKKHDLPVILHTRKSHDSTLKLLKQHQVKGGIAHAFNGSLQHAHQYIDLGFKLGFGGMLTFERSTKLRQLARLLPLDSIVLETDAPDMTVAQHRGERNSPEYLPHILTALAELRSESIHDIAHTTRCNTQSVLALPK